MAISSVIIVILITEEPLILRDSLDEINDWIGLLLGMGA